MLRKKKTEVAFAPVQQNNCSNFTNVFKKIPVTESILNNVSDLHLRSTCVKLEQCRPVNLLTTFKKEMCSRWTQTFLNEFLHDKLSQNRVFFQLHFNAVAVKCYRNIFKYFSWYYLFTLSKQKNKKKERNKSNNTWKSIFFSAQMVCLVDWNLLFFHLTATHGCFFMV